MDRRMAIKCKEISVFKTKITSVACKFVPTDHIVVTPSNKCIFFELSACLSISRYFPNMVSISYQNRKGDIEASLQQFSQSYGSTSKFYLSMFT